MEEWDERREEETEIDLAELGGHIWSRRNFIARVTGVFVILGLLVALLSPVEYETEATLIPEVPSSQTSAGSLLEQYGGLLGMSGNFSLEEENTISPKLYPQIVSSLPFQLELLNKRVEFTEFDTTVTVYKFFNEVYTPSVFSYAMEYSLGLPAKIKGLFIEEEIDRPLPKGFETDSVISVTKEQMDVIEEMQERITVSLNEETGIISLILEMPDPGAAAQLGKASIGLIKDYVTNYRTRKAKEDLKYAQEQLVEVKNRFEEAQNRLAEFRDSNRNLTTAKAQTQEERLQSEYDLAFNVYNTLAQQVEQAKLKVQEQTPVVSILQPVQVPIENSSPQTLVIILFAVILGAIGSLTYVLINYQ